MALTSMRKGDGSQHLSFQWGEVMKLHEFNLNKNTHAHTHTQNINLFKLTKEFYGFFLNKQKILGLMLNKQIKPLFKLREQVEDYAHH